jgi:hypothetical protein
MTIKTQNGKVITKDGKVSCECCEAGICGFYPAIGMQQGLYTPNDLPDEIYFTIPASVLGEEQKVLFSKSEDSFYATVEEFDFRISPVDDGDPIWQPGQEDFNITWQFQVFQSGDWDRILDSFDKFLFRAEELLTESTYADSYAIVGPVSGTVNRVPKAFPTSLETCEWIGDNLILRYNGRFTDDPLFVFNGNFKWQVNGNNKIGDQNTPVGSYEGGFTVS